MSKQNRAVYPTDRDEDDFDDDFEEVKQTPQFQTRKSYNQHQKPKPEPKKKKAGCCFKACLSVLVLVLIVLVGGIGAGWYFGDRFMRDNFDVSLSQAFRIVGNAKDYRKASKKIDQDFKAAFTTADADGFVDSLGDAILLNPGSFTSDEIKEILVDLIENNLLDNKDSDDSGEKTDYVQMLVDLYSDNGINKQKLAAYDETNEDESVKNFYVQIRGRQLTAFLNDVVLNAVLSGDGIKAQINDALAKISSSIDLDITAFIKIDGLDFKDVLQVRQISFYKNDNGEAGIKLITQTKLKKVLSDATKNFKGEDLEDLGVPQSGILNSAIDMGAGFGRWFVTQFILPKELYLSVEMPLSSPLPARISLNNTDKKDWDTLKKIVREIGGLDDIFAPGGSIGKIVNDLNTGAFPLGQMIQKSPGSGGVIEGDIVSIALEFMGVNYEEAPLLDNDGQPVLDENDNPRTEKVRRADKDCITSKDLYFSLKYLIAADTDAAMMMHGREQKDYTRYTFVTEGGKYVFDEDGLPMVKSFDGQREGALLGADLTNLREEYEQLFIDALTASYGLKDGLTFDQIFDMLLMGESTNVAEMFESPTLKAVLTGENARGAVITDKMLAAIVAAHMEKFLGENGGESSFDLDSMTPRYIALSEKKVGTEFHNFAEIGIELNLLKLLDMGDLGAFGGIISAILPDSILLCAKIDITLNCQNYAPTEICIDSMDFGDGGMDRILKIFNYLGVFGGQSTEDFVSDMLNPIRTTLNTMSGALEGIALEESKIALPDVYEAVTSLLNRTKNTETDSIDSAELEDNLKFVLCDVDWQKDISGYQPDEQLNDYLNWAYALLDGTQTTELFDAFEGSENDVLNKTDDQKLKAISDDNSGYYSDGAAEYLLRAYRDVNSYDLLLDQYRLGRLLLDIAESDKGESVSDYLNAETLKYVGLFKENGREYIELVVEVGAEKLMSMSGGGQDDTTQLFVDMMDKLYMTFLVDITADNDRVSKVIINDNEQKSENLFEFLKKLDIDLAKTRDDILDMLETNVSGMFDKVNSSGMVEIKMTNITENTFVLTVTNLFDAMSNMLKKEKTDGERLDGEDIKEVMYSIYKPEIHGFAVGNPVSATVNKSQINQLALEKISALGNITTPSITVEFADYELGGLVAGEPQNIGTLLSLNVIAANDNTQRAIDQRAAIKAFDGADLDNDANYIMLVYEIALSNGSFLGSGGGAVADKLLPQKAYGTLLIKEKAEVYELVWFKLNDMDKNVQSNLYIVSGANESDMNNTINGYFDTGKGQISGILADVTREMDNALAQAFPWPFNPSIPSKGFSAPNKVDRAFGAYRFEIELF